MTKQTTTALITPSHAADFEHCRLLCDSIDRFVHDQPRHYILVDNDDYDMFLPLAGQTCCSSRWMICDRCWVATATR